MRFLDSGRGETEISGRAGKEGGLCYTYLMSTGKAGTVRLISRNPGRKMFSLPLGHSILLPIFFVFSEVGFDRSEFKDLQRVGP